MFAHLKIDTVPVYEPASQRRIPPLGRVDIAADVPMQPRQHAANIAASIAGAAAAVAQDPVPVERLGAGHPPTRTIAGTPSPPLPPSPWTR